MKCRWCGKEIKITHLGTWAHWITRHEPFNYFAYSCGKESRTKAEPLPESQLVQQILDKYEEI